MVDKDGYEGKTLETETIIEENITKKYDTDADKTQHFQNQCPNLIFLLRVMQEVVADYESAELLEESVDAFYSRNVNFLDHFRPSYNDCADRESWCDETISHILKIQNTIRFLAIAVNISAHFEEKNQDRFFWNTLLLV
jgi:hypothetical protein